MSEIVQHSVGSSVEPKPHARTNSDEGYQVVGEPQEAVALGPGPFTDASKEAGRALEAGRAVEAPPAPGTTSHDIQLDMATGTVAAASHRPTGRGCMTHREAPLKHEPPPAYVICVPHERRRKSVECVWGLDDYGSSEVWRCRDDMACMMPYVHATKQRRGPQRHRG